MALNIDGTAFAFDGTEDNAASYAYQRDLAALIALTLPTGSGACNNSLYFSKYLSYAEL